MCLSFLPSFPLSFSHEVESGSLGCRLARGNFYGIVRTLLTLGLMCRQPEFNYKTNKVDEVYRIVVQPIGKRRPPSPSLMYEVYLVCEAWNREFAGKL